MRLSLGSWVCPSYSRVRRTLVESLASDLSTATVKRNSDLETRLAELELEISVWKQAHAAVLDVAERDKKAHNAQVSTLNRQISSLDAIKVSWRGRTQSER